jgi:hypothetical protein
MIVLTDKGLSGKEMEHFAADRLRALLVRPDRKDEKRRFGNLAGMRQWIESVNDTLNGQLDLEQHGGRTEAGVYVRVAQRVLALAAVIWHNWDAGMPDKTIADRLRPLTGTDRDRNHSSSVGVAPASSSTAGTGPPAGLATGRRGRIRSLTGTDDPRRVRGVGRGVRRQGHRPCAHPGRMTPART